MYRFMGYLPLLESRSVPVCSVSVQGTGHREHLYYARKGGDCKDTVFRRRHRMGCGAEYGLLRLRSIAGPAPRPKELCYEALLFISVGGKQAGACDRPAHGGRLALSGGVPAALSAADASALLLPSARDGAHRPHRSHGSYRPHRRDRSHRRSGSHRRNRPHRTYWPRRPCRCDRSHRRSGSHRRNRPHRSHGSHRAHRSHRSNGRRRRNRPHRSNGRRRRNRPHRPHRPHRPDRSHRSDGCCRSHRRRR